MATERMQALERGINQLIKPELVKRSFIYDSSTKTFRRSSGACTQIISFQVGVRSMEGKFTVNLAVFHPEYHGSVATELCPGAPRDIDCLMEFRQRLAVLRDTLITKFFKRRIRNIDSILKWWLVTPSDKWWPFTSDSSQVAKQLELVRKLLLTRGLDWLERNNDEALLKTAHDASKRRFFT